MRMKVLGILLFCAFFVNVASQRSLEIKARDISHFMHNLKNITDILSNSINALKRFVNMISWFSTKNDLRPFPIDFISNSPILFPETISPICRQHISFAVQTFLTSIKDKRNHWDDWSMQMFDSLAKPPSGIFKGNVHWMGDFWECIEVEAGNRSSKYSLSKLEEQNNSSTEIYFTGEYCLITIKGNTTAQLEVGVCLPNSCTLDDKSLLIDHWIRNTHLTSKLEEKSCYTNKRQEMDTIAITIACCLMGIILFVIIGSIGDNMKYPGRLGELFAAISVPNSFQKVFNLETRDGDIHVLHGIRVLTLAWIILAHCYQATLQVPLDNLLDLIHAVDKEFLFGIILNATLAVDAFFMMSSTLVTFNFLKKAQYFKCWSLPKMYLLHYIRLTPAFMVTVAILAGPFYYLKRGPLSSFLLDVKSNCRKHWWDSMLYIFNFTSSSDCNFAAWYLAVDMQLFIVISLLLYPLYRKPKWGLIGIGICIVLSLVAQMLVIYHMNIEFIFNSSSGYGTMKNFMDNYYTKPWGHLGQYLVGLILGYFLHSHFYRKKISITKALSMTFWIISTLVSLTVLYGTFLYSSGQLIATPTFNVLFGSLSRIAWTMSIAWIIFACSVGSGGIIATILSWKYFMPLSRISFSCYLIQNLVIMTYFVSVTQPIHFEHYRTVNIFVSIWVGILLLGFLLCVFFEMPLNSLCIFLISTTEKKKLLTENGDNECLLKTGNL